MDFLSEHIVILGLFISLLIQSVFFTFAYLLKTDKFTDLTYGLTFILLGAVALISSGRIEAYKLVLLGMIITWGLRLITYLFYRISKIKKDSRFDKMRNNFIKFARFWFLQGISVWIIMLPTILLLAKKSSLSFGIFSMIGVMIWGAGLIIETMADIQKFTFKSDPKNKEKWIDVGIWKYSRHPNYFGEILCWIGVFVFTLPNLSGLSYTTVISPIYITFLLLFVSGIPILEKRYDERFKNDENYQRYKKRTSLLIPLPKSVS